MGCSQNHGPLAVIDYVRAFHIYLGVPKWDPKFGNPQITSTKAARKVSSHSIRTSKLKLGLLAFEDRDALGDHGHLYG